MASHYKRDEIKWPAKTYNICCLALHWEFADPWNKSLKIIQNVWIFASKGGTRKTPLKKFGYHKNCLEATSELGFKILTLWKSGGIMMMFQSGQYYHCFPEATPVCSQSITNLVDFTSQVAVKFNHFSRHPSRISHHSVSSYCIFFLDL